MIAINIHLNIKMERSTFDGKVFHAHCDTFLEGAQITTTFSEGENQYGLFAPTIFLVIKSDDLMSNIQQQLRKQVDAPYPASSVTIQLGDSAGEHGSEMLGANTASRLIRQVNLLRQTCCNHFVEHSGGSVPSSLDIAPTAAGLRLYPKLPEDKKSNDPKAKQRELAIKYGAIPDAEGNTRDVSAHSVTIMANMFGFYKGAFYLNFRLCAPFKTKDKPEVLAEVKKPRKRAAPKAASAGKAGASLDLGETGEVQTSAPTFKRARPASASEDTCPGAPRKAPRKTSLLTDAAIASVDPSKFESEEALCMAYVRFGLPLRTAAQLALDNFMKRGLGANEDEPTQEADESVAAAAGAGAGAGASEA